MKNATRQSGHSDASGPVYSTPFVWKALPFSSWHCSPLFVLLKSHFLNWGLSWACLNCALHRHTHTHTLLTLFCFLFSQLLSPFNRVYILFTYFVDGVLSSTEPKSKKGKGSYVSCALGFPQDLEHCLAECNHLINTWVHVRTRTHTIQSFHVLKNYSLLFNNLPSEDLFTPFYYPGPALSIGQNNKYHWDTGLKKLII